MSGTKGRRRFAKAIRGSTGHVYTPHQLSADLVVEHALGKKLKHIAKHKSVAGGPLDFSKVVQDGLDYLAKQPERHCAVENCKGTPAYQFYGKFWCFKHRDEARNTVLEHNRKKYAPRKEKRI